MGKCLLNFGSVEYHNSSVFCILPFNVITNFVCSSNHCEHWTLSTYVHQWKMKSWTNQSNPKTEIEILKVVAALAQMVWIYHLMVQFIWLPSLKCLILFFTRLFIRMISLTIVVCGFCFKASRAETLSSESRFKIVFLYITKLFLSENYFTNCGEFYDFVPLCNNLQSHEDGLQLWTEYTNITIGSIRLKTKYIAVLNEFESVSCPSQ